MAERTPTHPAQASRELLISTTTLFQDEGQTLRIGRQLVDLGTDRHNLLALLSYLALMSPTHDRKGHRRMHALVALAHEVDAALPDLTRNLWAPIPTIREILQRARQRQRERMEHFKGASEADLVKALAFEIKRGTKRPHWELLSALLHAAMPKRFPAGTSAEALKERCRGYESPRIRALHRRILQSVVITRPRR
jgi:hypothetical protein